MTGCGAIAGGQVSSYSGYSMTLRGNLKEARRSFLRAYEFDPNKSVVSSC